MGFMNKDSALLGYRVPQPPLDVTGPEFDDKLKSVARIARIAAGTATQEDMGWLQGVFDSHLRDNGTVPLERRMGLPKTYDADRVFKRNRWLCHAALHIGADGSWAAAKKLEYEWNRFITRGAWPAWRDDEQPPNNIPPLSEALFYATRLNRSESLCAQQIYRIVQHIFTGKCC
jgi:hypothetical protein